MAGAKITLQSAGMKETAKSLEMQRAIEALAEKVADNVRSQNVRVEGKPGDIELPVEVRSSITDRARSTVTITHASGLAVQAKHGALTRAAAEAGLEVKSKS